MTMIYSNSCLNKKKVFLVIPADLEIQMENYIKSTIQCNDRMS